MAVLTYAANATLGSAVCWGGRERERILQAAGGTLHRTDLSGIEAQIQERMRVARVPGLAVAAVRGQDVVYAAGFGVTSTGAVGAEPVPVTPETLFRIGSIAKPLTGTLIVRLADAGVLDLDRPIRSYLPRFTLSAPAATERVTLRMLLTHTSGIPHRLEPLSDVETPAWTGTTDEITAAALEHLARHRLPRATLIAPPGKVLSYSTAGISLAGYVAQEVCGKP